MSVVGLVVEYNPFHNGHLHHIENAKKITDSDSVICVMSGNFIQRGEPAIFDKWARTKMALLGGADLVIELPVVYAMSSAEYFAKGAVSLLNSCGIVDSLCFGSESGSMDGIYKIAEILANEPLEYKELLKSYLDGGISYPAAREKALGTYIGNTAMDLEAFKAIIGKSNNILGVEYLKWLIKLDSKIKPYTIKREGNSYNDININGSFSSASSIRESFRINGINEDIISAIPESTYKVVSEEGENGRGPVYTEYYDMLVLGLLRRLGNEGIESLPFMSEGLHNRLYKSLSEVSSIAGLIDKCSTKRYTRTRVCRAIMHSLTGLTEEAFNQFNNIGGPSYIRVLGFNNKGRDLLGLMKKKAALPIITKPADYIRKLDETGIQMFNIESFSTDMYVLGYPGAKKGTGQEFTRNIVRIGL